LKEEAFLKDINWVNDFRFKVSTGTSGNSGTSGSDWNYQHLATVSAGQYNAGSAWGLNSAGNPELSWEKQALTNVGIEATLFNKLNVGVEYFNRNTSSLLMDVPYPYTTGYSSVKSNVGK